MRQYSSSTKKIVFLYEGRKIEPQGKGPPPGEFTYSRLRIDIPRRAAGERRSLGRLRTKLRSGAIADRNSRVIVECLIHDRTDIGARLRLMRDRPIPTRFHLVDEVSGMVAVAALVWRRGREVGVRLEHQRRG